MTNVTKLFEGGKNERISCLKPCGSNKYRYKALTLNSATLKVTCTNTQ